MIEQVIRKSASGATKWMDNIFFNINSPKTYAASVLLKNYYWELDEDNRNSFANRMRLIGFSRSYLTTTQQAKGSLKCSYCPKDNLIIELEGMRVPNGKKATIDHIIPISEGGALFDTNNICVACGSCNSKKGSLSVDEFLATRKK